MNLGFLEKAPFVNLLATYTSTLNPGFVLFGHGVTKNIIDTDIQRIQLHNNDFVKAIEFLEKLNFRFISMEQFQEIAALKIKPNYPWVHLTFDDGYKNNLTELYPYLKQKQIPFTIFISINHIVSNKRFDHYLIAAAIKHTKQNQTLTEIAGSLGITNNDRSALINLIIRKYKYISVEEKNAILPTICNLLDSYEWEYYNRIYESEDVLSVDDLKLLAADPLVHIGSHGYNHYIQTTLTENERMLELQQSYNLLEQLLEKQQTTFCYQNGGINDFSAQTKLSCQKANYKFCFTTIARKWEPNTDLMEIPRFPFTHSYLPQLILKAPFS